MNDGPRRTCFLSSSKRYPEVVDQLARLLMDLGVETIRADYLISSSNLMHEITKAIETADFVVMVIGRAIPKNYSAFEFGLAVGMSKPVLLIALDRRPDFDLASNVHLIKAKKKDLTSAKNEISFFLRHALAPISQTKLPRQSKKFSWVPPSLVQLQNEKGDVRQRHFQDLIAKLFAAEKAEILHENRTRKSYSDLYIWHDDLVADLGGPLIVECKYYQGSSGSVIANARQSLKKLSAYVEKSSARLGLLVFAHERPTTLSIRKNETPDALAFSIDELINSFSTGSFAVELMRRRNQALHLRRGG